MRTAYHEQLSELSEQLGDDLFGEYQIGLQQCLRCAFHRNTGQPAHLSELF